MIAFICQTYVLLFLGQKRGKKFRIFPTPTKLIKVEGVFDLTLPNLKYENPFVHRISTPERKLMDAHTWKKIRDFSQRKLMDAHTWKKIRDFSHSHKTH